MGKVLSKESRWNFRRDFILSEVLRAIMDVEVFIFPERQEYMNGKRNTWVVILSIVGMVLVWGPVAAPLLFGVISLVQGDGFRVDYLMPAELGLFAFAGGFILLAASLITKACRAWVAGSLAAALIFAVGGQVVAYLSGLATGTVEPEETYWWWVVIGSLAGYALALIAIGFGGVCLLKRKRS